jgi:hypothetical protein
MCSPTTTIRQAATLVAHHQRRTRVPFYLPYIVTWLTFVRKGLIPGQLKGDLGPLPRQRRLAGGAAGAAS